MPLDISKIVREVRKIVTRLPAWRFLLVMFTSLVFAFGYLSERLPWDKLL